MEQWKETSRTRQSNLLSRPIQGVPETSPAAGPQGWVHTLQGRMAGPWSKLSQPVSSRAPLNLQSQEWGATAVYSIGLFCEPSEVHNSWGL